MQPRNNPLNSRSVQRTLIVDARDGTVVPAGLREERVEVQPDGSAEFTQSTVHVQTVDGHVLTDAAKQHAYRCSSCDKGPYIAGTACTACKAITCPSCAKERDPGVSLCPACDKRARRKALFSWLTSIA